ncbi:hypothetical protein [Croceimicrobium sp.]|uniref:hypothetical protein n=1 Tax=Croceimicrobium sp. TaxID=2828340 RepID=UPI003BADBC0C
MRLIKPILTQVAEEFAQSVIDGIAKNIREKDILGYGPMNNTGRAADSMGYTYDGRKLVIYSNWSFFWTLETGRGPGKMPPIDPILDWVQQRGIYSPDVSPASMAFLIARKIGREGSLLYRSGGNSGIITEYTSADFIQRNLTDRARDELIRRTIETLQSEIAA